MLKKSNRLTTKLFPRVIKEGQGFHGKFFSLKLVRARNVSGGTSLGTRFSVAVSKKIDTRAVVRNRIKRRALSVLRKILPVLAGSFPESFHGVLIAKKGVETATFKDIKDDIEHLFKASIIR